MTRYRRDFLRAISAGVGLGVAGCSTTEPHPPEPTTTESTPSVPENKLVPANGEAHAGFDYSVALSNGTSLITARWQDGTNGSDSGAAYVFDEQDRTWEQTQVLEASDGGEEDFFGYRSAVSGDTALIGAPGHSAHWESSGAAYVFERVDGEWVQQAKLAPDDEEDAGVRDHFGWGVALSGDTAMVGAFAHDTPNGRDAGAVYVFERADGEWVQQAKLTADDGDEDDKFGTVIALEGSTALVGARDDDDPHGEEGGSAYVFERIDGAWQQQAKLASDDGDAEDNFGSAIALDGTTAAIGALRHSSTQFHESAGAVYVFERADDGWTQQTKLEPDDIEEHDAFGGDLALAGDTILAASPLRDRISEGGDAGAAYVFTRTADGWEQQRQLAPDDGDPTGDQFGFSVALDGSNALIGANNDEDPNGPEAGAAYIFEV